MSKQDILIKAIAQAFHEHYEALHRYAYTILRENETAKDVVQKVFLSLLERTDKLEIKISLQSYLFRSVYNHCINHRNRTPKFVDLDQVSDEFSSGRNSINQVEVNEVQKQISAAIEKLPPQCKIVFLKNREEEKTYSQVASEMGIAVKTVEAQMTKALKILRIELAEFLSCLVTMINLFN
ncbi:RNA polymerase sigma-70 factor [Dyadobacter flavalbus]|uniref:RNA polymerase sigma-70 factor n=1 Tax=Dyadobacter flavalbus TaxID=2579942 RepID=A0A5M8QZ83_9BACT|nr:RNA polymerase sigma-70 factor [Dyadobacter flavalbus]KAA6440360.1 RNA polymerase sigma-70 factor [Dyadobacter flavalbus]